MYRSHGMVTQVPCFIQALQSGRSQNVDLFLNRTPECTFRNERREAQVMTEKETVSKTDKELNDGKRNRMTKRIHTETCETRRRTMKFPNRAKTRGEGNGVA